jgi:hypothetical protein
MKMVLMAVVALFCVGTSVHAQDTCKTQAEGKSLHGAALTSFAKKCCNDQAAAQKLHGAAKTSFTKKCLSDATGA